MSPKHNKILKEVLILVGAFAVLHSVASFSLLQSLVLMTIGYAAHWWSIDLLAESIISTFEGFDPFWLNVSPNWGNIMFDFKLVESMEEYEQIWEKVRGEPEWKYNLVRDGIRFVFLMPSAYSIKPRLAYNQSLKYFSRNLYFFEEIRELERPDPSDKWGIDPTFQFYFFIKDRFDGYEIGLHIPPGWYQEKHGFPKPPREFKDDIILAILPHQEFVQYWHFTRMPYEERRARFLENRALQDKALQINHWVRKVEEIDYELPKLDCEQLEHRYVKITHGPLK